MSVNQTFVRVMYHDVLDNITISRAVPVLDTVKFARDVYAIEDKKLEWCGGARLSLGKFYNRVCIVDAATLKVLLQIYSYGEWPAWLGM